MSGNLGYFPTVDAARWFGSKVWPRIRAQRPAATWLLAGSRPGASVRRLAAAPGVQLIADPPDLIAEVRRAAVAIAPLHAGSGTPIKILEAMAHGVAVVTTAEGAAGLDGIPDEAVAVADRPEDFARCVLELLDRSEARQRQVSSARRWLIDRHGPQAVGEALEAILRKVLSA